MIDEGTPFCPHCGAPQIRVAVPESDSPPFVPGTPAEMQPAAEPVHLDRIPIGRREGAVDWHAAFPTVSIAGVITGFASWLPLGLLWVIAGGIFAVILYRKRHPELRPLSSGGGAKIGAATGLAGYVIFSIIAAIDFARPNGLARQVITGAIQQASSRTSDPAVQQMYQKMSTPEGMAFFVTFIMAFLLLLFLGFGAVGGAVGASLTRRNRPQN